MRLAGTGKLLRIFVGERDRHGVEPLYASIVAQARKAGLAGATVFRGIEGFGAHSVVHLAGLFDLSSDLPVLIEIVDTEPKIRDFLPLLDGLIQEGLVTMETVEIIQYRHGPAKGRTAREARAEPQSYLP